MTDSEKVLKGLECCVRDMGTCDLCPYEYSAYDENCGDQLFKDILALLKAREPRMETQGRWERVGSDGIVCCSVCGIPMNKTRVCWPDNDNGYYYIATKYCPHCGARNEKGDCDG